jgi:Stage II sporulation protein M
MRAPHHDQIGRTVALVAAYQLAVATAGAVLTRTAFQRATRGLLRVHFAAVAHHAGNALAIWLHNATIVMGFAVFLGCAQFTQRDPHTGRAERTILRACDGALMLWATGTAVLAGALAGAYGSRQLHAFLPQGPIEVTAWALLIALYIKVRRQQVAADRAARVLMVVLAMLAVAAVLELWVGG